MTRLTRALLLLASAAVAALLIFALIRVGGVDVRETMRRLAAVRLAVFLQLVALNGFLILLSAEKWRAVDAVLRRPEDVPVTRAEGFAMTSIGMATGMVLPVQLGMAAARTVGTLFRGKAVKRGTAGSLFEQSFDVLVVAVLAVASGLTLLWRGSALMWLMFAVVLIAIAVVAAGPCLRLLEGLAAYLSRRVSSSGMLGKALAELSDSRTVGLLSPSLARRLILLSSIRFVVVVLMAGVTAEASGTAIAIWRFAAAMPFATMANAVAITPGGIGVNELTSAGVLHLFGTPLADASQWTIANRFLGTASCFVIAAWVLIAFWIGKLAGPKTAQQVESR